MLEAVRRSDGRVEVHFSLDKTEEVFDAMCKFNIFSDGVYYSSNVRGRFGIWIGQQTFHTCCYRMVNRGISYSVYGDCHLLKRADNLKVLRLVVPYYLMRTLDLDVLVLKLTREFSSYGKWLKEAV